MPLDEAEKREISCDLRDLADAANEAAREIRHERLAPIVVRAKVAVVKKEADAILQRVADAINS